MTSIFISHSSRDNEQAIKVRDWLVANGWQDIFLDLDPERGIAAGQRWKEALQQAAHRCELVLALVSPAWLTSGWCKSEVDAARLMGKKIIVALIGADKAQVPLDLTDEQWIDLLGDPAGYRRLREGLKRAGLDPSTFALPPGRRPYPGFAYFEEEDAAIFFGRDAQIVRALDRMRGLVRVGVDRMLVILGASGSGKSSFLRAGLKPRLQRDDRAWLSLPVIRPERAVISGPFGLTRALHQIMNAEAFAEEIRRRGLPRSRADIQAFVTECKDGLLRIVVALREIAQVPGLTGEPTQPPTVVLSLDQGEEMFNAEGRGESGSFIDILNRTLNADPRVLALVAMRSDSFPLLQNEARLAAVSKDTFTLDMMLEGSYRAVIEGPARLVDPPLKIDPQLVDALLEDISGQDALPLLAFTLAHLHEHYAADNEINLSGYERLGRLNGVIDTSVTEALQAGMVRGELPKDAEAQLALVRAAFIPHLVQVNATGQFVRRVATIDEIPVEAKPVIDRFADQRLLIRDRRRIAGQDAEIVEVAHEALLRQPPLSQWLQENREFLVWRERLGQARAAYEANERGLLTGQELRIARDWLSRRAEGDVAPRDHTFIADSIAEDDRRIAEEAERESRRQQAELDAAQAREMAARETADAERRVAQRTRVGLFTALILLLLAGAAGIYALIREHEAVLARNEALLNQSRLLTDRATQEIAQGDPVTGALLALEALPDASSDQEIVRSRPHWPPAEVVLERARRALREQTVFTGHNAHITGIAVLSGGARIATSSSDKTVRIWDANTGAELGQLKHGKAVTVIAVATTSDGQQVVSGSTDGKIRIWNPETGMEMTEFGDSSYPITALAITSDAARIVAASSSKIASVWDKTSGRKISELRGHKGVINAIAVSSDGARVVTGSDDGTARIWDAESGLEMMQFNGHRGGIASIALMPDGAWAVTAFKDRTVRIWDMRTGAELYQPKKLEAPPTALAIAPDASHIVAVSDRIARVWNTNSGVDLVQLIEPQGRLTTVAFTPDGSRLITGSDSGTARIWDVTVAPVVSQLYGHRHAIRSVAVIPDGTRIITGSEDATARIWDPKSGAELGQIKDWSVNISASLSDSAQVFLPSNDGTFRIFDETTKTMLAKLKDWGSVDALAIMSDGIRMVTASKDGSARVWDIARGVRLAFLKGNDAPLTAIAVSPDGREIVTASKDKTVLIWNANEGNEIAQLTGLQTVVNALAFTPDGTRLVTGFSDGEAQIWDFKQHAALTRLKGHNRAIRSVAVMPGGTRIVTGSDDATARIWDINSGTELVQLRGHNGNVNAVTATPDGTKIVTGSDDSTARIWDAKTGAELAQLQGHRGAITSIAVTSDGARIITGSSDKTTRIWEMFPTGQALISEIKDITRRCLSPTQRKRYYLSEAPPLWCSAMEKWPYSMNSALAESRRLLVEGGKIEAEILITEILKRAPSSREAVEAVRAEVSFDQGLAMLRSGRDEDAETYFSEAMKYNSSLQNLIEVEQLNFYIERGRNLLQEGKDDDAEILFRKAKSRSPSAATRIDDVWVNTYIERGKKLIDEHEDQAEILFEKALNRDPSAKKRVEEIWSIWASNNIERSGELLEEGKKNLADSLVVKVLKHAPWKKKSVEENWALTYLYRGRGFLGEGKNESAESEFAKALQHDMADKIPNQIARVYISHGGELLEQGLEGAAETMFAAAFKYQDPDIVRHEIALSYVERGGSLLAKGEDDEAERMFSKALERDSSVSKRIAESVAKVYNELALSLYRNLAKNKTGENLAKAEQALKYAESAAILASDDTSVIDTRGSIYFWLERLDDALADFDRAIKMGINDSNSYFRRGRCYELKGDQALALLDYRKAVRLGDGSDEYSRRVRADAGERLANLLKVATARSEVQMSPPAHEPRVSKKADVRTSAQCPFTVVRTVQRALQDIGYTDIGPADGVVGARTIWAITQFRLKAGMSLGSIDNMLLERLAVGNIRDDTLSAPSEGGCPPAPVSSVEAQYNIPGPRDQIMAVQRALRDLGFMEIGAADGQAGPRTIAAITRFREENGMAPGIIDDALLRRLGFSE